VELRDIEIFLTLCEELHFGRTAERLHVSQARVSQAIKKQERRIGGPLFERTSRRVALTPIGRRLRDELQQGYDQIQSALAHASAAGQGLRGTLHLGVMGATGEGLRPVIAAFEDRYPTCHVEIIEFHFSDPFGLLRDGTTDVQLMWLPIREPDLTVGPVVMTEGRVLAVRSEDPLAAKESASMEDLGDRLVLDHGSNAPDYWVEAILPRYTPSGRRVGRGPVVRTFHEILSLVASGQIVSPLNAHVRHYYRHPGVAILPIADAPATEWTLVWRTTNDSPQIQAFVETARDLGPRQLDRGPRRDPTPGNLPTQLTSFVGRAEELAEVERLLRGHRLVTLSGAGGCGKTRLAARAAAGQAERWPGGIWWIDLGAVNDPDRVPGLVGATVGALVEPAGDPLRALAAQLRSKRLLLCLDTCEHVLDAAAKLAETLLQTCSELSVLATSREPLGVVGETVWRVPSMVEEEAVRLFAERAALVRSGFDLDADAETVGTICRRVDGIPLAIELAAAGMRVMTATQIAAALDDRLGLLAGSSRGVIARQQTLAASMEWSHDLLTELDRVVFRRLAVLAGGFTLDAARQVCADDLISADEVLTILGRLVDKSLVVMIEGRPDARYRLLDTVRQYAEDRLRDAGEAELTRDRHLDHFLRLVEGAEPELERDQDSWRVVLEADNDNIRAALEWGLGTAEPTRGRRLAAAMARQWFIQGRAHEGIGFLRRAIDLAPDERSRLQARLLCGAAMVGEIGGQLGLTVEAARRGLELAAELDDD
jgi:predicted ATPase/DNA-binding transcriptional LysR family regulator